MKEGNCVLCKVATAVVCLGAINWGLLAFFQIDLIVKIFGPATTASQIAYGVVAVAGVIKLINLFASVCPCRKSGGCCEKK